MPQHNPHINSLCNMGCFPHETPPLKPTKNCTLISKAYTQCHSLCLRTRSSLSSEDENPNPGTDHLDNIRHVMLLEIHRRRAMTKPPKDPPSDENLRWVFSSTSGELLIAPKSTIDNEEESDDGTEAFYSVKSRFSLCASEGRSEFVELRGRSMWEEFRHCEGWPFGLRRRALLLPPLPTSPSDSWTWRKRRPC